MLPDLPKLKNDLMAMFSEYLRNQVNRNLGFLAEVPKHSMPEGNKLLVLRSDGSSEESDLFDSHSEIEFEREEMKKLDIFKIKYLLDKMAFNMATQIKEKSLKGIIKTLGENRNIGTCSIKDFNESHILKMFEDIQIDFYENGEPHKLEFIFPESMREKVIEISEKINSDPEIKKKHDELMNKKRKEWIDRETSRKLVG